MTDTNETQVEVTLKPCEYCGAEGREYNFEANRIAGSGSVWVCANNRLLYGGDCPNDTAYLYEAAWQHHTRIQAEKRNNAQTDELAAKVEQLRIDNAANWSREGEAWDAYNQACLDVLAALEGDA